MGGYIDEPDGIELSEWRKKNVLCSFGCEVPFEEKEIYDYTGMCGSCAQRVAKDRD